MASSCFSSCSGSPSLSESVCYALLKLQMSNVSLKVEQRAAMKAICDGCDFGCLLATAKVFVTKLYRF